MKSVLISIQPKWCELIASSKKTVEVRKTRPKIETPFKCFIYETKSKYNTGTGIFAYGIELEGTAKGRGKVIGEFVCDRIYEIKNVGSGFYIDNDIALTNRAAYASCLQFPEMKSYCGNKGGYAWHISNLKIYDKPKELGEFKAALSDKDIRCKYISKPYNPYGRQVTHCTLQNCCCEFFNLSHQTDCIGYEPLKETKQLTRPPQSWCYVED